MVERRAKNSVQRFLINDHIAQAITAVRHVQQSGYGSATRRRIHSDSTQIKHVMAKSLKARPFLYGGTSIRRGTAP